MNVSALQFADEAFPEKVLKILEQAGLPPACLELEITESMAMDDLDRARRLILPLKARGVRFALDDFGTGHSNLAALLHLPIEILKIDQCFVRGLSKDRQTGAIVDSILAMAAAMDYTGRGRGCRNRRRGGDPGRTRLSGSAGLSLQRGRAALGISPSSA